MARNRTRDDILTVSARLFARDGFRGTPLSDIAAAVGCSKATLLYHFAGKDAILRELLRPAAAAAFDLDARLTGLTGDDARAAAVDGFVDLVLEYRSEVGLLYADPHLVDMPALAEFKPIVDRLCSAFAGGSADPADQIAAQVVLSGLCQVGLEHAADPHPGLRDALTRVARRALLLASDRPTD
ncbi:TetR/AcrR family transcriptional regulator [Spirilliplanes yamanashiensis]|uniref:TetR family transcriptional regulator n=1 Tax=Spirilliplanes yamanashiensis TaxID=42233 RepID=A0A8J3Y6R6_9ACTN|nr:TetR/AcrR family transcriptional regulator [Spirilliplanes yamanashiensis]MDP9817446.1 AcrR family transcriptional regulator [Spirilliplanes yamanashiensis]GIJ02901.1 TetR family transcriptional regulator [Spirilliplanes yamanashiensis]